ncbi:MAG: hypothetical protein ISS45_12960, partial [Candidatus Omnitrophica bacterium]|nr:hypothetical protein [Candidatus Omnitrophota bacterium]
MFQGIIERVYLGNRIADYLIFVVLFLAAFGMIKIFQHFILRRLKKWSEKTATTIDDFLIRIIQRLILPLAYFGAFYLSVNTLSLHPLLKKIIDIIGMAILMVFVARLALSFIGYGFNFYFTKRGKDATTDRSLTGILAVLRVAVWALAI